MILPRTTLFHNTPPSIITSSQAPAQAQAQAQPTPSPESWSFTTSLPVSYRVAIFLDASILLLTLAILLGAIIYLRNRKPAHLLPQNRNHNLSPLPNPKGRNRGGRDEEQTLLREGGDYFDESLRPVPQMGEILKVGGERVIAGIVRSKGEKKKKGHVRWTDSVQGGEGFGESGNGHGMGKRGEDSKCNCKGWRHPGCGPIEGRAGRIKGY
ncbi:hypothetical protein VTL71DRAFT_3482 [Oculimacula yallundae]|uniref:Uncharacterized protein n=1 Tax=Oculimacula yallundae TaxID=86028 RepID=A0ABR4C7A3_9HELO